MLWVWNHQAAYKNRGGIAVLTEGEISSSFLPVKICKGQVGPNQRAVYTHVNGDEVDLCVTVFAGLGGRHVDNLARTALDTDVAVLPKGGTLHTEK